MRQAVGNRAARSATNVAPNQNTSDSAAVERILMRCKSDTKTRNSLLANRYRAVESINSRTAARGRRGDVRPRLVRPPAELSTLDPRR